MKQIFLWLGLALAVVAGAVYMAGSGMVDFFGFKEWTKGLGNGAGVILAILFLIGGVFTLIVTNPRNR